MPVLKPSGNKTLLLHLSILDENQENEVFAEKFAFDIESAGEAALHPPLNHYLEKAVAAFRQAVQLVKARYLNTYWNEQVYANVEEPVFDNSDGVQYFATYKVIKEDNEVEEKFLSKSFQTINLEDLSFSSSSSSSSSPSSSSSSSLSSGSSSSSSSNSTFSSRCSSDPNTSQKLFQKLQLTSKQALTQQKGPIPSTKPEKPVLENSKVNKLPIVHKTTKNIVVCLVIDVAQYAGRHFTSMYRYEQNFLFEIESEQRLEVFAKKAVKIWGQKDFDRLDLVSCGKFDAFYKEYLHVDKMLDVKVENGSKYMINYLLT